MSIITTIFTGMRHRWNRKPAYGYYILEEIERRNRERTRTLYWIYIVTTIFTETWNGRNKKSAYGYTTDWKIMREEIGNEPEPCIECLSLPPYLPEDSWGRNRKIDNGYYNWKFRREKYKYHSTDIINERSGERNISTTVQIL
jgi:hypothetical protein